MAVGNDYEIRTDHLLWRGNWEPTQRTFLFEIVSDGWRGVPLTLTIGDPSIVASAPATAGVSWTFRDPEGHVFEFGTSVVLRALKGGDGGDVARYVNTPIFERWLPEAAFRLLETLKQRAAGAICICDGYLPPEPPQPPGRTVILGEA